MSLDWFLLGLRLLATLILYTFLGVAFYIIWRELKQVGTQTVTPPQFAGQLRVMAVDEGQQLVAGQTLPLQPLTLLGRDDHNRIIVSYEMMSSWQVRLHLKNGMWWLEYSGEKNGATLNQAPLSASTPLSHGDLIEVDHVCFRLETTSS